jgi:hypothetical protein
VSKPSRVQAEREQAEREQDENPPAIVTWLKRGTIAKEQKKQGVV